jgi:hypothetical protein
MASIFQRGKRKTWFIKYYANGRQVYHSLKTTNARVAQQALRMVEGDEARGDLLAPSKIPLPEFLEDFCRFLGTIRTKKSLSADISSVRVFFGPICPSLELGSNVNRRLRTSGPKRIPDLMAHLHVKARFLEEITAGRIEDLLARRVREDGISAKTANRTREILHRMFAFAIKKWHYVSPDRRTPNPAAASHRPSDGCADGQHDGSRASRRAALRLYGPRPGSPEILPNPLCFRRLTVENDAIIRTLNRDSRTRAPARRRTLRKRRKMAMGLPIYGVQEHQND